MKDSGWKAFLEEVGDIGNFVGRFFKEGLKPRYEWQELLKQCYIIGYKSFPLVGITAAIMGLVLTVQSRPTLEEFGAESWLPAMVAISVIREIGPVITALICAGKIGSSIGAELGSMKVTEQIDALVTLSTNPIQYLAVPRLIAALVMTPCLTLISDLMGVVGGSIIAFFALGVTPDKYYDNIIAYVTIEDFFSGFSKSFVFGVEIALIACYEGFNTTGGAEGVGRSTIQSVVKASMVVLISDYFLTYLMQVI